MPASPPARHSPAHPLAPLAAPFIWFCLRLRLPAVFFTLLSLPLAAAAFWLLIQDHMLFALGAVFAAAGADAVDGAIARERGTTSAAGGYLDSMTDRVVDLLVLVGVMIAAGETRSWIVGTLALFGTLTTSAAKWRLMQELPVDRMPQKRDVFARTDRYIVILAGLLIAGLLGTTHQATALFWTLAVLAVATNLSVLVNSLRAWTLLHRNGDDP